MATKLFVGGLAYAVTEDQLKALFAPLGTIASAQIIMDRYSNQSKGFGFVEMSSETEAKAAIAQLNGKEVQGRSIIVSEARPPAERAGANFGSNFGRQHRGNRQQGRRY